MTNSETILNTTKPNNLRNLYLTLWALFTIYAFGLSPSDNATVSANLIQSAVFTPYDGSINPLFIAIFNFLGVYPVIFASLLQPGAKNQPIPSSPFVFGSFALGFFGLGPYLGLRKLNTSGNISEAGVGTRLFESKITPLTLLGFTLFLVYYGLTGNVPGSLNRFDGFIDMFKSIRLVNVSTIDFVILSLTVSIDLHTNYFSQLFYFKLYKL